MVVKDPEWASLHVYVSMLKRMHCWKLAEKGSGQNQLCTAIRRSSADDLLTQNLSLYGRCPCLTCSIKITQVGISEVVYSQSYSMDNEVQDRFAGYMLRTRY